MIDSETDIPSIQADVNLTMQPPDTATGNRDVAIRLIEQGLLELRGHRHEFKSFVNHYNVLSTNKIRSHRQIDDIHENFKVAQGALQTFGSIPRDLAEIKSGLLAKATDRSGIPYTIVMMIMILFALLVAIPNWIPLFSDRNMKLNVSRDGLGIESQQQQQDRK